MTAFTGAPLDLLVYDASPDGHRANYVRIFGEITGGETLVASLGSAFWRLLGARNLLLTTFETAPLPFLLITIFRSILGRRTAIICLRAHLAAVRGGAGAVVKRLIIGLLDRLPFVLPMNLVPFVATRGPGRFVAIRDPEFWDLREDDLHTPPTPLSSAVESHLAGRKALLLIGNLDPSKGLDFLARIFANDPQLMQRVVPILAGRVLASGEDAAGALKAAGAFVESRYLDHAELMSLFRIADGAWCCYPPDRDLSSGIFGRALQFGVSPVVRRGSVLDALSGTIPNAVSLDAADIAGARAALGCQLRRVTPSDQSGAKERLGLRTLLMAHFRLSGEPARGGAAFLG